MSKEREQWPQALFFLSGAVRAGLSLEEALASLAMEMPEPLKSRLREFAGDTDWLPLERRIESALTGEDLALARAALLLAHASGGRAAELLERAAHTLQMKIEMADRVRALTAQSRMSAWIVGGTPAVILFGFQFFAPDYVRPLFVTAQGWAVLSVAALLVAVGLFWVRRMAEVK